MSMDKPSDAKGLQGLRMTAPKPDSVEILIATICALLETVGELTKREPEAEALIKTIREEFGR